MVQTFGLFTRIAAGIGVLLFCAGACDSGPLPYDLGDESSEPGNRGEAMFRAIQPEVIKACGSCHDEDGSAELPFLGNPVTNDPDPYVAITGWEGVIVDDPESSLLITFPRYGQHSAGPTDPVLEKKLLEWLAEEAKAIDDNTEDKPTIPPFTPVVPGLNVVYLDPLGPDFEGMAVIFKTEELTPTSLSLSELEIHTTAERGVRFEHPLFTVYPKDEDEGDPDPIDSFSNVVQKIDAGQSAPLGPGATILINWLHDGRLSLNFEQIATIDPPVEEPTESPCVALDAFEQNARGPLSENCVTCHGGDNQAAKNAVDMSELDTNSAAACGQIRLRIDPENPDASQLFLNTDPSGSTNHRFKFGDDINAFNAFRSAVSIWIQAEAP